MNVSLHARAQLLGRLPAEEAVPIIRELEEARALPVVKGTTEARILRRFGTVQSDGQSNGDVLVAIIIGGTVVTCYWRRGTQTFDEEMFGVDILTDTTRTPAEQAAFNRAYYEKIMSGLRKKWGAR